MTHEQALAKVTAEIDEMLVKRIDDSTLRMIAFGVEADEVDEIVHEQRQRDAAWRTQTLEEIRLKLLEPW